jgi:hypothetical protein
MGFAWQTAGILPIFLPPIFLPTVVRLNATGTFGTAAGVKATLFAH